MLAISDKQVQESMQKAIDILRVYLPEFTEKFKSPSSEDNFYYPTENIDWTTGFTTGCYWLAYEVSGDVSFKEAALIQVDSFLRRIQERVNVDHHDMGFLYSLSCVAAYKLTGSETGKQAALLAADNLMGRFQEKGQFFQAWGELGAPDNYRLIIDCLLNLPLLYWASDVTGERRYREKAHAHAQTSLANLVRPDYSTYHTYYFDKATGSPLRGVTAQGYKDDSAWARGQAWGVYGLAMSYRYTQDPACIDLFYPVTDFFIKHLPQDGVPYWDLVFQDGDDEPRDSSALVIAACGMLEMAKYLPHKKAEYYTEMAKEMAYSLLANGYTVTDPTTSNGLLLHGVYAKQSPYNTVSNHGVDECNVWGDYFWMELLTRLTKDWELYW